MCQRFCEHCQSCLWLSHGSMRFAEKRQKIGPIDLCSRSTPSWQALGDLLDPFLRLSLLHQCPAAQKTTERHPLRKALFCRQDDGSFGTLLGATSLPAELMGHSSKNQDETQAVGVRQLLRQ